MPERGFLLSAVQAVGLGSALTGLGYSRGMVWWQIAENSASGQILARPHPDFGWFPVSTFQGGPGESGSAQLTGVYAFLNASATWISAGSNLTGTLTVFGEMSH